MATNAVAQGRGDERRKDMKKQTGLSPSRLKQIVSNVDTSYWKGRRDKPEDSMDPIAQAMNFIRGTEIVEDMLKIMIFGRKNAYNQLKKERKKIVIESMNHFSDICSMIDTCREGDEGTWETAKRLTQEYKRKCR